MKKYLILLVLFCSCKKDTMILFKEITNNSNNHHIVLKAKIDLNGNTNYDTVKNINYHEYEYILERNERGEIILKNWNSKEIFKIYKEDSLFFYSFFSKKKFTILEEQKVEFNKPDFIYLYRNSHLWDGIKSDLLFINGTDSVLINIDENNKITRVKFSAILDDSNERSLIDGFSK